VVNQRILNAWTLVVDSKKPTTCRIDHQVKGRLYIKAVLVWMTL
jgi:hypothetical protein